MSQSKICPCGIVNLDCHYHKPEQDSKQSICVNDTWYSASDHTMVKIAKQVADWHSANLIKLMAEAFKLSCDE